MARVEDGLIRPLGLGSDLLQQVRATAPDAFTEYRPRSDVVTGHRLAHWPTPPSGTCGLGQPRWCPGAVDRAIDAVHTLILVAGLKAWLRGRQSFAYGQPFYASWGLTRERAPIPPGTDSSPSRSW